MAVSDRELIDFVYAEARMLDELRFEDWLDLYTEDGHYWMPLAHGQTDAKLHASLMYEDKLLLRVRVERLAGQRTFSQQPKSRCHHLLQAPTVEHGIPNPRRRRATWCAPPSTTSRRARTRRPCMPAGPRITWSNRTARCASA